MEQTLFKYKNWEVFLILFLIPFLIHVNLPFVTSDLVSTAIFMFIWIALLSFWLFRIAVSFKTAYLQTYEIKLYYVNLIIFNSIYIILAPITLLLFYTDIAWIESLIEPLSKIDWIIRMYIYFATISNLIIASRIIVAKKLQRKISLIDHYKNTLAFIFLPIGIFWIQNEINRIVTDNNIVENKKRGYLLIGLTTLLFIGTFLNLKDKEFTVNFGKQNTESFVLDSNLLKKQRHQNDSILNSMDDSSKAVYVSDGALRSYEMGDFRNAIKCLNVSIQLDSLNPKYYYNRGVILYDNFSQADSAINDMTRAIQLDSNYCEAYQNRGYYNYLLKKYEISLPDINKVIKLKPDFSEAFFIRGEIKEQLNDLEGACSDWRMANTLGHESAITKIGSKCN